MLILLIVLLVPILNSFKFNEYLKISRMNIRYDFKKNEILFLAMQLYSFHMFCTSLMMTLMG